MTVKIRLVGRAGRIGSSGERLGADGRMISAVVAPTIGDLAHGNTVADGLDATVALPGNYISVSDENSTIVSVEVTAIVDGQERGIDYVVSAGQTVRVRYRVTDSSGIVLDFLTAAEIVTANPVVLADTASLFEGSTVEIDVLANDTDPDGGVLAVSSATASAGFVSIGPAPGYVLTYNAAGVSPGAETIDYTVRDGQGGVASGQVTVTVEALVAPTISAPTITLLSQDDLTARYSVEWAEPGGGTVISRSRTVSDGTTSYAVTEDVEVTFDKAEGAGLVTATDQVANPADSDSAQATSAIPALPAAPSWSAVEVSITTNDLPHIVQLALSVSDGAGVLTYALPASPEDAVVTPSTGALTLAGSARIETLALRVTDAAGRSADTIAQLEILPPAPVWLQEAQVSGDTRVGGVGYLSAIATGAEPIVYAYQWTRNGGDIPEDDGNRTFNDLDEGQQLGGRITATDAFGRVILSTADPVLIEAAIEGAITWDPAPSLGALVEGDDPAAAVNSGSPAHVSGAPVIVATIVTPSGAAVAAEEYTVRQVAEAPDGTLGSSPISDPVTAAALAVSIAGTPEVGEALTATPSAAGGAYQWQRDEESIAGATESTYTLQEADGGAEVRVAYLRAGITAYSDPASVPVPNQPPVATDDTATVAEGETTAIDVLTNDTDADGNPLELVGTPTASSGSVSILTSDGSVLDWQGATIPNGRDYLSFDATGASAGSVTLGYTVSDGTATDAGSVAVTVEAAAGPQAIAVTEGTVEYDDDQNLEFSFPDGSTATLTAAEAATLETAAIALRDPLTEWDAGDDGTAVGHTILITRAIWTYAGTEAFTREMEVRRNGTLIASGVTAYTLVSADGDRSLTFEDVAYYDGSEVARAVSDAVAIPAFGSGTWSITDNGDGTFDMASAPAVPVAPTITDNGDGTLDVAA